MCIDPILERFGEPSWRKTGPRLEQPAKKPDAILAYHRRAHPIQQPTRYISQHGILVGDNQDTQPIHDTASHM